MNIRVIIKNLFLLIVYLNLYSCAIFSSTAPESSISLRQKLPFKSNLKSILSSSASSNGKYLALGGTEGVEVWNRETNLKIKYFARGFEHALALQFDPADNILAVGSYNTLNLINITTGLQQKLVTSDQNRSSHIKALTFSPDGTIVASSGSDKSIKLWNVEDGKLLKNLTWDYAYAEDIHSLRYNPDGKLLASASSNKNMAIRLWNVEGIKQANAKENRLITTMSEESGIKDLAFSPDGMYLAAATQNNRIALYKVENDNLILHGYLKGHTGLISKIEFSHNNKHLLSTGLDKTIRRWDIKSKKLLETSNIADAPGRFVMFSNKEMITVSEPDTITTYYLPDNFKPDRSNPEIKNVSFEVVRLDNNLNENEKKGSRSKSDSKLRTRGWEPVEKGKILPTMESTLSVAAWIDDENGIDSVLINGVDAEVKFPTAGEQKKYSFSEYGRKFVAELGLDKDIYRVDISAIDKMGNKTEKTVDRLYESSWAVIIGINDYANWNPLEYAVNDAFLIRKTLESVGFNNILILTDKEATRKNIAFLFEKLQNKVGQNDRVMVFFAGHGYTYEKKGYIIPVDAFPSVENAQAKKKSSLDSFISMSQLKKWSKKISGKDIYIAIDACLIGGNLWSGNSTDNKHSIQIITAGREGQVAVEENGHGIFTKFLNKALNGAADSNNNGIVVASEIASYVRNEVSFVTNNKQEPLSGYWNGDGNFQVALRAQT